MATWCVRIHFLQRYDGPYTIAHAHADGSTYTLDLPSSTKAFPTVHSSHLKRFVPNDDERFPSRKHEKPGPIVGEDGQDEWPVEKLLDRRRHGRGWQYLVRWLGYGPDADSWISGSEAMDLEAYDDWLAESS